MTTHHSLSSCLEAYSDSMLHNLEENLKVVKRAEENRTA